ncbi:class IV lanthionine synthetase LanL [Bailinhaonella thermotolerans]|uniref:non-specific serine/threonine protein kinase n=1 Tax=Bailinhaonella thermotolerans TaxID=1070861 RepID=A0A3A4A2N4_9ACTN|nr:class IV lanthionine synthetase LanL [Bailinhaonella thermotolerans]RJL22590.1 serine/threonine protein kinase [Bailinhaonella thermotolerans]
MRGDTSILRDIVTAELARSGGDGWSAEERGFWCKVAPDGYPMPDQGWKLHVSATILAAPVVLARAARVLLGAGCAFKFPVTLDRYWELLAPHSARAQAGKFITVYPRDDAEAVRLAALLDEATRGLPGPAILSDRPYRPGSLVHYRYGAFTGHRVLGNDGIYEVRLRTPDGVLIRDERLPSFSPPPFAISPFPSAAGLAGSGSSGSSRPSGPARRAAGSGGKPRGVVLNGRFVVREAIRHANRGGVYVAEDVKTGDEVIVKEGRPHACSDLSGRDARDRLAAERDALLALAPTGGVPGVLDFFEQGGHAFLAQESIRGLTAQRWADECAGPLGTDGFGCPAERVTPVVAALVRLLREVHGLGYVFRDLSPGNVMIQPGGEVRLIDLEYAARPGTTVMIGGTPGYLAPELARHSGEFREAPGESADLYGLGALTYFLATGSPPGLWDDEDAGPAWGARAAAHVARVAEADPTLALLSPMVTGLLAEPGDRWSLAACAAFLDGLPASPLTPHLGPASPHLGPASPLPGPASPLTPDRPAGPEAASRATPYRITRANGHPPAPRAGVDELVADGLAWLGEILDPREDAASPWPNDVQGFETDPCSVGSGAAGVLPVLPAELAGPVARWLRRRLAEEDVWPPGLYSGRSGALWSLYENAPDDETREFARAAAHRLPTDFPSPDVTHGLAGCAMSTLRVAVHADDDPLRDRAGRMLAALDAARSDLGGHPHWPTPPTHDSTLAGLDHYGFAHGLAGIGTALLYGAAALGRADWLDTAHEIAATFRDHAELDGDTVWWPSRRGEPESVRPRSPHWCSGSSGIGSFLVRHWYATGDAGSLDLARRAARAVHRTRWQTSGALCHGLPGEGDFLLDMAAFTGEERYRRQAGDLAECLAARAVRRDGRLRVPDRLGEAPHTYLGGTAGVLSFLLRLRGGGPRAWTLDDVLAPAPTISPFRGEPVSPSPGRVPVAGGGAVRDTGEEGDHVVRRSGPAEPGRA